MVESALLLAGLNDLDVLDCRFPDGLTVEARRCFDLPWGFIFEGLHPAQGRRYFRARRRGDAAREIEVWDVTEAVLRCLARRLQRTRRKAAGERKALHKRLRGARIEFKPGLPTPERRRRGPLVRATIPNLEAQHGGPPNVDVHRAPDRLVAMHKRGTLSSAQLEAAERFHRAFIAGACDPGRAADLHRIPGAKGAGLPDAVLDAKHEVFAIYDHLGGRGCLGARVLMHIVGLDRAIDDCVRVERGRDNWVNKQRVVGVLAAALDSVCGYYAGRSHLESLRRRMLEGAEIGVLSQGA